MKKVISFLVCGIMVLGLAWTVTAAAPAVTSKKGIVKGITASTVTLGVDGKNSTYTFDKSTKILLNDMPAAIEKAAKKGTKASFKASGNKLLEINFEEIGEMHQGAIDISVIYRRLMDTDTNTDPPGNGKKEDSGIIEEDTGFGYRDNQTVSIGSVVLVPETLKVVLNGKELKVIDEKTPFKPDVLGDEVQTFVDTESENETLLKFEQPITDNAEATFEDIQKILSVSFKKKLFKLTITELYKFDFNDEILTEVNGKEVTLVQALNVVNRGAYAYITLNPSGRIIYIDAFFNDIECVVDSVSGDTINVSVFGSSKVPIKETLKISQNIAVENSDGSPIKVSDLKANDKIKLTVDPYEGYKVIFIIKK